MLRLVPSRSGEEKAGGGGGVAWLDHRQAAAGKGKVVCSPPLDITDVNSVSVSGSVSARKTRDKSQGSLSTAKHAISGPGGTEEKICQPRNMNPTTTESQPKQHHDCLPFAMGSF